MAECDLSLSYTNARESEKLVKLSYASWCPTCNKDLTRRRTFSDTGEPYKRRGKEMKTFTPKKYNRCREYENMELEYETKDVRFDCCRIRSNLCELPTTYITNNCQLSPVVSNLQKLPNGMIEFDSMKSCDNYKLTDSITINDRHARAISKHESYLQNIKPHYNVPAGNPKSMFTEHSQPVRTALPMPKLPDIKATMAKYHHTLNPHLGHAHSVNYKHRITQEFYNLDRSNCNVPSYKPLTLEKSMNMTEKLNVDEYLNKSSLSYDTNTYFNQNNQANIKDRYTKEIELLRKKLRELRAKRTRENGKTVHDVKKGNSADEHSVEICDLNKELGNKESLSRKKSDTSTLVKKERVTKGGYKVPVKAKIKPTMHSAKKLRKPGSSIKHSTTSLCVER